MQPDAIDPESNGSIDTLGFNDQRKIPFVSAETWLAQNGMGPETVGLARVLGFTWLGIIVGLIRTFINGPDGNNIFFTALIIAQLGLVLNLWHQYLFPADPAAAARVLDDAIAVSVLAILLLIGWFRLRARL